MVDSWVNEKTGHILCVQYTSKDRSGNTLFHIKERRPTEPKFRRTWRYVYGSKLARIIFHEKYTKIPISEGSIVTINHPGTVNHSKVGIVVSDNPYPEPGIYKVRVGSIVTRHNYKALTVWCNLT